jgi:serine/threonine-protein kinase
VKTDPKFALGFASLGEAYRLKYLLDRSPKWIEEATSYSTQAVALDDRLPSSYVTLGRIHDASGKYDLAVQEFQHALQLDSRNADAIGGLALAQEKAGRLEEAEKALKRSIALRPDYWDGYNSLALFYDRQNRFDDAIAQLRRASELTPDNAQVFLNLGAIYCDTGDPKNFAAAETALKKSLALSPRYEAYANLGQLLFLQHRFGESASATEKALQLNDKNYLVWRNLAGIYAWLKQPTKVRAAQDRELALLEETSKIESQNAELLSEMAAIYADRHMADKAVTFIQRALALAPENSSVLMDASEVYEALANRPQAVHYALEGLAKGYSRDDLSRRYDLQGVMTDPSFTGPSKQ